jgi:aryl-alcohol dehydrogenase-like predicted oxidoreductase
MKTRTLGSKGPHISEIGLGCWQLGGSDWGDVDDAAALNILHAAADTGVNFLDTADVYGGGRSEKLIASFLKERSGSFFVATKLGRGGGIYPNGITRQAVREAAEASLKRLGVPTLDLVQLHCVPTEVMRQGDVFGWLEELKAEGKIRHFGASVESMEEANLCMAHPGLASLQIIFNIFRQKATEEVFAKAAAKGVGIIVRLPFASGLLSGAVTANRVFPDNDHRKYNRNGECFNVGETFAGLPLEVGVELAERVKALVPEGMTLAEFSLRWILDFPEVSTIIPGASKPAQATANASASKLAPLSVEVHQALKDLYLKDVLPHLRGPN